MGKLTPITPMLPVIQAEGICSGQGGFFIQYLATADERNADLPQMVDRK